MDKSNLKLTSGGKNGFYWHKKQVSIISLVETYHKQANIKIRSTFEGTDFKKFLAFRINFNDNSIFIIDNKMINILEVLIKKCRAMYFKMLVGN